MGLVNCLLSIKLLKGVNFLKRKVCLFIFIFLASIGFSYEIETIGLSQLNNNDYLVLFLTLLLLCLYIIPGLFLLKYYLKNYYVSLYLPVISMFGGAFISGWLSAFGNDSLQKVFNSVLGESQLLSAWSDAFSAPLVEESFKLVTVILVFFIFNLHKISEIFCVGISVGFGFQVIEDVGYVTGVATDSIQEVVPQVLTRLSGSISSHWAYTGILAVGIYCFLKNRQKITYIWIAAPFILHLLWNSPINEHEFFGINVFSALLTTITILIVISILNYIYDNSLTNNEII